ncbi:hypothetical protein DICSQDRAFT_164197 [Dichomitus squalens LYAD-421 SS1]|uniref:Uncharacterized protein n=1 Tax=Dichomitus squalens (strain LYAD-421) TaxID=732165 RepID=R7SJ07_DICSQ|nr:uncharacterized protein DICSQDRAFT_164197 [Dichomitus squalens LYAD-421 SS1]EJF55665.1 hypothetical protein DICSQDRAFT_164197 [Dichomitus squalens LYAD-421 SS1]
MSFIPSSAASSATSPSITGASSLLPLLAQTSSLSLQISQTRVGTALLAQLLESSVINPHHPTHAQQHLDFDGQEAPPDTPGRRVDKLPFADIVGMVRDAPAAVRSLPIVAVESFQKGGENVGLVPHRYSVITITHPHDGPPTFMKLHLRAVGENVPVLTAELSDDRSALIRPCDRRLAALELSPGHPVQGGPSLDALAQLLDIIQQRVGRYDVHGRNCLWLADLVLFGSALKFSKHWLAEGRISPDQPIRQYLRGEIDVLAATTQCFLPPGLPWWLGNVYAALGKTFGAFNMHDEVANVVREWKDYLAAAPLNYALLGVA